MSTAAHYTNEPEEMDRPELIALVKFLRGHLESAKKSYEDQAQRLHVATAQREDLRKELESTREAKHREEDARLNMEEAFSEDLKEMGKFLGRAALRLQVMNERVNPS